MRILAVIPACEGSIRVPNKNIRVINGKPLIYYVIDNARQSKYITDVIVTTNSNEIITIANQMGVLSKMRSTALCGKEVLIDAVIYDVFEELDLASYDYVVTMQSISPTLKVETLDAAIECCIDQQFDTVISVANRPRFSWTIVDGIPVPNQDRNVSRHYLPPFYEETGAFLITKSQFVRPESRLGNRIHLCELSGSEAIDIDTWGDLKQVESIFCHKSAAFYVNGNNKLGLGHVYRVIELADEFFFKPDIYYDINQTDPSVFGDTTHNLIPVDGVEGLLQALSHQQYDRVINDILSTSREYMEQLRLALPHAKIINFEDEGTGAVLADLVFNALYEDAASPNVRAGDPYFIASKLFLIYNPIVVRDHVKDIFIGFGGADPQNYTDRLLRIIDHPAYHHYQFHVVIGRAKHNAERLLTYNSRNHIEILYDIDNMPEVMSKCDIAITSRGRTGYELALLGLPTIAMAQNERELLHTFISDKNGFSFLGINPEDQTIECVLKEYLHSSAETRMQIQNKLLSHNLRNGIKHVMDLIDNL